ncbi:MAG: 3-hydroxyacyl-CoA dehydrogenase NAD-binding domain-containing protein [Sphingobium sp.]
MTDIASWAVENGIGVVEIDSPPVNALGIAVRRGLLDAFNSLSGREDVKAIVLLCRGRTFFAGADISEFGRPLEEPDLATVLDVIENGSQPVVAAMHGTALGGGLELALVCHYRIAVPSARMGLPEVHLGLLPGAGGTQRLPRVVGVEAALDLIVSGRQIGAREALGSGILDALAGEDRLREDAVAFARSIADKPPVRIRDRQDKLEPARANPALFDEFRARNARAFRGFKAPEHIVRAIEASVDLPFEEGMKREWASFLELEPSIESQAQRYYFFAERDTAKIPDIPAKTETLPIKSVGVIGAGTMGGGIAMNFLNAGLPVTLVETSRDALDRGLAVIRRNYENSARKGKIRSDQVEARMAAITPALSLDALSDVDLAIEAVFEEIAIKKDVFGKLDAIVKPGAILASNTSFLDLDEIASATRRPEWVVGLHFFSPANVMRLVEVVRGQQTRPDVIVTAMKLAKTIGKVPVLSRVCDGFIANRIMAKRGRQADRLMLQGVSPERIDKAIFDYGFAMGHFAMMDLVGLDVIGRGSVERTVGGDLVAMGRLGQKQNGGYYDYDEARRPSPAAVLPEVIASVAAEKDIAPIGHIDDEDILARLLYPVVNEGARLLEEGIALRASDIDVAAVLGYNWPVYTGGPMFWADTVGLQKIVDGLRTFDDPTLEPSALLVQMAADGRRFTGG